MVQLDWAVVLSTTEMSKLLATPCFVWLELTT
ncbi:hypothetical protein predicted by Glimmer/Critica [Lactiplantibacillus plantarum]|nr:hypothetical protein predicted by Glimmer/Critica [Lactiplantibacillus plantarum]